MTTKATKKKTVTKGKAAKADPWAKKGAVQDMSGKHGCAVCDSGTLKPGPKTMAAVRNKEGRTTFHDNLAGALAALKPGGNVTVNTNSRRAFFGSPEDRAARAEEDRSEVKVFIHGCSVPLLDWTPPAGFLRLMAEKVQHNLCTRRPRAGSAEEKHRQAADLASEACLGVLTVLALLPDDNRLLRIAANVLATIAEAEAKREVA